MDASRISAWALILAAMAASTPTARAQDDGSIIRDSGGCAAWNPHSQAARVIRWSGQCKDGWLEGPGTVEWLVDGRTVGLTATTMRRGRASGFTRDQALKNGTVTEVIEAEFSDGRAHGYGQWRDIANDVRYLGEFADGRFDGLGTLFRADGSRVEGQFRKGVADGFVTEALSNGALILGIKSADKFTGPGTLYSPSKVRVETTFANDAPPLAVACRQFAPSGTASVGTVVAVSRDDGKITCKPTPGTNTAAFSSAALNAINTAAKAHGYPANARPANPYLYIDQILREQSAKLQSREAGFAKLADVDAAPLPDGCLAETRSEVGKTSVVSFQNRCDVAINVNICLQMDGFRGVQRQKQQVAARGTAQFEFANPQDADYRYEFSYCRPDRTQTLDNCLSACP